MSTLGRIGGCLSGLALAAGGPAAGEPPAVTLPRADTAPAVDGRLDDPAWSGAAVLTNFHVLAGGLLRPRADTPAATRVLLLRDDAWLYAGFDCSNAAMRHVTQQVLEPDGPVHLDDSVELFFDPGTGGELYLHFLLSWANVRGERRITNTGGIEPGWTIPWRSAAVRGERGWTGEAAIPLLALTSGGDAGALRMNATRTRVTVILDAMGAQQGLDRDIGTWAPLDRSGHEPARFGRLEGLAGVRTAVPFLPWIESVSVGGYEGEGAARVYRVQATVRAHTVTPGTARLVVRDAPSAGPGAAMPLVAVLAGMSAATVTAAVPAAVMAQRAVRVELEGGAPGEVWQRAEARDTARLTVMRPPLPDRDYYTDEDAARVRCEVGLPPAARAGLRLSLRAGAGAALAAAPVAGPETVLAAPLGALAMGTNRLTAVLADAAGNVLMEAPVALLRLPPNPGAEVKVDRFRRVLRVNGRPFFAFGLYGQDIGVAHEGYLRALSEAGFNLVGRVYNVRPWHAWGMDVAAAWVAETKPFLDLARKHRLMVLDWAGNVQPGYVPGRPLTEDLAAARTHFEAQLPDLKTVSDALRGHPAYLGYQNVDEPNLLNADTRIAAAEWYYTAKRAWDPWHPALLLYAQHLPAGEKWMRWGEMICYDIYLYPGWGQLYHTPHYMALKTMELESRAAAAGQVLWMVPMAEALDPGRVPRALTPAEQRAQTYLALIHGAKGLLYFCSTALYSRPMWDTLASLAREVEALAPALLEAPAPQRLDYRPTALDRQAQRLPDVQAALFRHPAGGFLLLAANAQWYPVETVFRVAGLDPATPVRRLFGGADPALEPGAFRDTLERYGTRAYRLAAAEPAAGEPLAVTVEAVARPEKGEPIALLQPAIEAISKRRNVMPNPSFETCTVSGLPDFVLPMGYIAVPRVGDPDAPWGLDARAPVHGRQSLRMRLDMLREGSAQRLCRGLMGVFYPPPLDRPAPYVFSASVRGRKAGDRIWLRILGREVEFPLTPDWQRIHVAGTCGPTDPANGGGVSFLIYPVGGPGAELWLDAMQVEAGTAPTPFTLE